MKYINIIFFVVLALVFDALYAANVPALQAFMIFSLLFFGVSLVVATSDEFEDKRHWCKNPGSWMFVIFLVSFWGLVSPETTFIPVCLVQGNLAIRELKEMFENNRGNSDENTNSVGVDSIGN